MRLPWVNAAVDELAQRIMRNINAAAAVTPINLLAVTLLATPRQTLPEPDLVRQLELYQSLLKAFPYSAAGDGDAAFAARRSSPTARRCKSSRARTTRSGIWCG